MRGTGRLRFTATLCVRMLRRVLRRFRFSRFCRQYGPLKIGIGDVHVVSHCDRLRIPQPLCDHRQRKLSNQIRFAARTHGMPQARPRLQTGAPNNLS
jgi:hypothetical protein